MDLLEDLRMSLLNFDFLKVYIIHKILVLLKNHLNWEWFFKKYNRLLFFKKTIIFFIIYNDEKSKA